MAGEWLKTERTVSGGILERDTQRLILRRLGAQMETLTSFSAAGFTSDGHPIAATFGLTRFLLLFLMLRTDFSE